jgi:hypothetical protein
MIESAEIIAIIKTRKTILAFRIIMNKHALLLLFHFASTAADDDEDSFTT